jgi:D-arabinono-1,4-lactone oxidase
VEDITLVLANGTITTCSLENDPDLFRAALVSLGALGIIIRITLRASQAYNMAVTTETVSFSRFLEQYDAVWLSADYVRAWWWPYTRKVVIWRGNRTQVPETRPAASSFLTSLTPKFTVGKNLYEVSLYALTYTPSLTPSFERLYFSTQFPNAENVVSATTISNPHQALQMDCFFSQYVDEWAIPLESGPRAIVRMDNYLSGHDTSVDSGIPVSSSSSQVWVHAPIELRVNSGQGDLAYLSPARDGPVLYIGVIMYRPYCTPTKYREYFSAYELLMREFHGKPHWAKQHWLKAPEVRAVFGDGMQKWLAVRERVDPKGMFVNAFVRRHIIGTDGKSGVGVMDGETGRLYKRFRAVL